MIRIGLLSFWHVHARDYARQAVEHPDTEIVAAWDENPERGREQAKVYGARFHESLDDFLAQSDIDAVIADAPTTMHREVLVKAAQAGKHIFTEKVLAATLADCNAIVKAVEESGVKLVVSLRELFNAYPGAIKQIIDDGLLGTVTMIRVRDAHDGAVPLPDRPDGWLPAHFFNVAETAGGALIDLGCHPMYLSRFFGGLPDSVTAHYGHVTGHAVDDNAVAILGYANGALGIVETAFVSKFSPFSIEISGTKGSLHCNARDGQLTLRSTETSSEWVARDIPAKGPSAFETWVTHIQNGTTATENIAQAVDLTRLMEAANRSAAAHTPIRLADLNG
ncbi:MAG: Gfo/Idh/MocA family oxidoreductase [Herpetosiphonaceae bacterium]|nr:Gfo/Idh/MocA family oxidoreductase [Herpetosiphonaceae bacterium]